MNEREELIDLILDVQDQYENARHKPMELTASNRRLLADVILSKYIRKDSILDSVEVCVNCSGCGVIYGMKNDYENECSECKGEGVILKEEQP